MAADGSAMRITVVVASKGRPAELADTAEVMARQTRPPHRLIYSVTGPEDLPDIDLEQYGVEVLTGPPGSSAQRNTALEACLADSDVIAFFDDDYVPEARALEEIARAFGENAELSGLNGVLLADGIHGTSFSYCEAMEIVREFETGGAPKRALRRSAKALMGCHMVFRASAIEALRFDEALPAYGWQEDIDFSGQVRLAGGRLFFSTVFAGVHRGSRHGRSPGLRLGYSQIANPVYLARKGTMEWAMARRLIVRNVLANHLRAIRPEPGIDRLGRMKGNWRGVADWIAGSVHPMKITKK